jgi:hypothetical protein
VPGWIIDHVIRRDERSVVVAARRIDRASDEPDRRPAPVVYATSVIAGRDHDEALSHEISRCHGEVDDAGPEVIPLGERGTAFVLTPDAYHRVTGRRHTVHDVVPQGATPPLESPLPLHLPRPLPRRLEPPLPRRVRTRGARPRVRRLWLCGCAGAALAAVTFAVLSTAHSDRTNDVTSTPRLTWDARTAIATVDDGTSDRRYRLGEVGDQVELGDLDGDGQATPVLYRPSTGELWAFDAWAVAEGAASARLLRVDTIDGTLHIEHVGGRDLTVVHRRDTTSAPEAASAAPAPHAR